MRHFDLNRKKQLEELLDIVFEKRYEFEQAIEMAAGADQKIALKQQIKREINPQLLAYEKEYADLLACGLQEAEVSEEAAQPIITEIFEAAQKACAGAESSGSDEIIRYLKEISEKLNEPGKSAIAKLKTTLPIIPLITRLELELDIEKVVSQTWRKIKGTISSWVMRPQARAMIKSCV